MSYTREGCLQTPFLFILENFDHRYLRQITTIGRDEDIIHILEME